MGSPCAPAHKIMAYHSCRLLQSLCLTVVRTSIIAGASKYSQQEVYARKSQVTLDVCRCWQSLRKSWCADFRTVLRSTYTLRNGEGLQGYSWLAGWLAARIYFLHIDTASILLPVRLCTTNGAFAAFAGHREPSPDRIGRQSILSIAAYRRLPRALTRTRMLVNVYASQQMLFSGPPAPKSPARLAKPSNCHFFIVGAIDYPRRSFRARSD